jgi:hypothetical protein
MKCRNGHPSAISCIRTASLKFIVLNVLLIISSLEALSAQVKLKTFSIRCNIVSDSGEPLSDVAITGNVTVQTKVSTGIYALSIWDKEPSLCCVLRFSHDGYQPVTKAINAKTETLDVVLKRAHTKWIPPDYSPGDLDNPVGSRMKISIPTEADVRHHQDVDVSTLIITYPRWTPLQQATRGIENDEQMKLISGALLGFSMPSPDQLASSLETIDRDLVCGDAEGSDIRGQTKDGKMWRSLWIFNETIRYKGASPEAADFFDSIISTLHCDRNR